MELILTALTFISFFPYLLWIILLIYSSLHIIKALLSSERHENHTYFLILFCISLFFILIGPFSAILLLWWTL